MKGTCAHSAMTANLSMNRGRKEKPWRGHAEDHVDIGRYGLLSLSFLVVPAEGVLSFGQSRDQALVSFGRKDVHDIADGQTVVTAREGLDLLPFIWQRRSIPSSQRTRAELFVEKKSPFRSRRSPETSKPSGGGAKAFGHRTYEGSKKAVPRKRKRPGEASGTPFAPRRHRQP